MNYFLDGSMMVSLRTMVGRGMPYCGRRQACTEHFPARPGMHQPFPAKESENSLNFGTDFSLVHRLTPDWDDDYIYGHWKIISTCHIYCWTRKNGHRSVNLRFTTIGSLGFVKKTQKWDRFFKFWRERVHLEIITWCRHELKELTQFSTLLDWHLFPL